MKCGFGRQGLLMMIDAWFVNVPSAATGPPVGSPRAAGLPELSTHVGTPCPGSGEGSGSTHVIDFVSPGLSGCPAVRSGIEPPG